MSGKSQLSVVIMDNRMLILADEVLHQYLYYSRCRLKTKSLMSFERTEYFGHKFCCSRWPTSLVAFGHNAVLERNSFIIYHMLIDDGGTLLIVQQCNMVPHHKVHLYFLITVL